MIDTIDIKTLANLFGLVGIDPASTAPDRLSDGAMLVWHRHRRENGREGAIVVVELEDPPEWLRSLTLRPVVLAGDMIVIGPGETDVSGEIRPGFGIDQAVTSVDFKRE